MYTSYSKVIIDLPGRRSVDLVRKTPCLCGEFSLAGALRFFIENSKIARDSLASSETAGHSNRAVTVALYRFLKRQDFEPKLMVGYGYKNSLNDCCPQLNEAIKEKGLNETKRDLCHGIVRVNDIAFDLTHRRLGDGYLNIYNVPYREWAPHWIEIRPMGHVVEITPEETQQLVKNANRESALRYGF